MKYMKNTMKSIIFLLFLQLLHVVGYAELPPAMSRLRADDYGKGSLWLQARNDLMPGLQKAVDEIRCYKGGTVTSSGGLRPMNAEVSTGRSPTSLHYLGRAVDLFIGTGMQGYDDKYIVVRDGGTDDNPLWKVYCRVEDPAIPVVTLKQCIWRKSAEPEIRTVSDRALCITDILEKHGWKRISGRKGWKDSYLCCEWWHFQNEEGLIPGESTFRQELMKIYPLDEIMKSPLKNTDGLWNGSYFQR